MSGKKIVVLIINCLQGGGAERSVLTLGQGFFELGFEVHIVRFKPLVEYDLKDNLNYHLIHYKPYKLILIDKARYKQFAKKVDAYILNNIGKPQLVLSNLERSDRVMRYSQMANIAYIIRNTTSKEFDFSNKKVIKDMEDVYSHHPCICVSKGVEEDLKNLFGNRVNTTTIYNAFDKSSIRNMAESDHPVLSEFNLKKGKYIVHVGSFKYQKAHDILLQAYARSNQDYPLVLVGKGKMLEEMKHLAIQLGISQKVYFVGFHKNPYPIIANARFMVLSSRFEGFVRVVGEALALDVPVISTDCPSGPNELLPMNNLVDVDDIEALAERMSDCMQYPESYAVPFNDKFLPKNVAQNYVDYLIEGKNN